jgi:hypothetical protein
MNYNDNMSKMAQDHASMKVWHENMAKSAADSMQDHIKAAAWHDSQANLIKSMINEVPLNSEEKKTTIPAGSYSPAPSSPTKGSVSSENVPLDPDTVKKSDLVSILNDHVAKHGDFDMDVETIASFLINK